MVMYPLITWELKKQHLVMLKAILAEYVTMFVFLGRQVHISLDEASNTGRVGPNPPHRADKREITDVAV